jgi:hypothetical protein
VAGLASVIEIKSVYYPESDGKPMGETDEHRDEMVREIELLRRYYRGRQVSVLDFCSLSGINGGTNRDHTGSLSRLNAAKLS